MTQLRLAKNQRLLKLQGKNLLNELTKIKTEMKIRLTENVTKQ